MQAAIYLRGSANEGALARVTLAEQRKFCSEYCAREGLTVDRFFVDEGTSAIIADRPEFQRMLSYCLGRSGRIQYVVVYTLDRFARNTVDYALIAALLKHLGIRVQSAREPIDPLATGALIDSILAAFAQVDKL